MNVIFLDFDGVVNTVIFEQGEPEPDYSYPHKKRVNNYQAICWLNKLCRETDAKIVVSSSWRLSENCNLGECLYNGGLNRSVRVLGSTPRLPGECRGAEIKDWLEKYGHEVENFIIIDDDSDMEPFMDRLVKCDTEWGFGMSAYHEAKKKFDNFLIGRESHAA